MKRNLLWVLPGSLFLLSACASSPALKAEDASSEGVAAMPHYTYVPAEQLRMPAKKKDKDKDKDKDDSSSVNAPPMPSTPAAASAPQSAPVVVAPPPLKSLNLYEVKDHGNDDGKCAAKAVVKHYGAKLENYRYNYYIGFRQGLQIASNGTYGDPRSNPNYNRGYDDGAHRGATDGKQAGFNAGSGQGSGKASNDVFNAYKNAVMTHNHADAEPMNSVPPYGGANANLNGVESIDSRVADFSGQFQTEIMNLGFNDDEIGDDSWNSDWSIVNIYNQPQYNYGPVKDSFKPSWALDKLQSGKFKKCRDDANYLTQISDASTYANASDAAETYRKAFKDEYKDKLESAWMSTVNQPNPPAQATGMSDGAGIYNKFAYDAGNNDGYSAQYRAQSAAAFPSAYQNSYNGTFNSEVKRYENGAVIHIEDAAVLDNTGKDKKGLVVAQPMSLQLRRVVNYGTQPADVKVYLSGNGVQQPSSQTIHLDPSAVFPPKLMPNMGFVSKNIGADDQGGVQIHVGDAAYNDAFQNTWDVLIYVLAYQKAGSVQSTQYNYVADVCAKEIAAAKNAGGNPWKEHNKNYHLVRMSDIVHGLPGDKREWFKKISARLLLQLGERPSGLFHPNLAAQFDSVQELLKGMQ